MTSDNTAIYMPRSRFGFAKVYNEAVLSDFLHGQGANPDERTAYPAK